MFFTAGNFIKKIVKLYWSKSIWFDNKELKFTALDEEILQLKKKIKERDRIIKDQNKIINVANNIEHADFDDTIKRLRKNKL